jgi:hypothetical protein
MSVMDGHLDEQGMPVLDVAVLPHASLTRQNLDNHVRKLVLVLLKQLVAEDFPLLQQE